MVFKRVFVNAEIEEETGKRMEFFNEGLLEYPWLFERCQKRNSTIQSPNVDENFTKKRWNFLMAY